MTQPDAFLANRMAARALSRNRLAPPVRTGRRAAAGLRQDRPKGECLAAHPLRVNPSASSLRGVTCRGRHVR